MERTSSCSWENKNKRIDLWCLVCISLVGTILTPSFCLDSFFRPWVTDKLFQTNPLTFTLWLKTATSSCFCFKVSDEVVIFSQQRLLDKMSVSDSLKLFVVRLLFIVNHFCSISTGEKLIMSNVWLFKNKWNIHRISWEHPGTVTLLTLSWNSL